MKTKILGALLLLSACSSGPRELTDAEIDAIQEKKMRQDTAFCQFEGEKVRISASNTATTGLQLVAIQGDGYDRIFNACMKMKGYWK